jgi:hypothetical protein
MERIRPVRRNPDPQVHVQPHVRHGRHDHVPSAQSVRTVRSRPWPRPQRPWPERSAWSASCSGATVLPLRFQHGHAARPTVHRSWACTHNETEAELPGPGRWCPVLGALGRQALVPSERLTSSPAERGRDAGDVWLSHLLAAAKLLRRQHAPGLSRKWCAETGPVALGSRRPVCLCCTVRLTHS